MRTSWRRRVLIVGLLAVTPLGVVRALANGHFARGVVAAPASYVEPVPTSYVEAYPTAYTLPTSYVEAYPTAYALPTSYVVPTGYAYAPFYAATSYVLNSSYAYVAPTAYYPRSLLRRPRYYVERPVYAATAFTMPLPYYSPTSALYPTAYPSTVAAVASNPCPEPCADPCATTGSAPYAVRGGDTRASGTIPPAASRPATPTTIRSTPENDPEPPARGAGASSAAEGTTTRDTAPPPNPTPAGGVSDFPTPPSVPAAERGEAATPLNQPADGGKTPAKTPAADKAPVAPGGVVDPPPVGEKESILYEAKKPVYQTPRPFVRTVRNGYLNVLEGKVVSNATGQPEEGVRVVVSNRLQTYADRVGVTNAFGRYAVRLPDGDWTVKVTTPGGQVEPVSELVVSNGQINDDLGRDIPTLTIHR